MSLNSETNNARGSNDSSNLKTSYQKAHRDYTKDKSSYYEEIGKRIAFMKPYTRLFDFENPFYNFYPDA